jgi:hypothetical protein
MTRILKSLDQKRIHHSFLLGHRSHKDEEKPRISLSFSALCLMNPLFFVSPEEKTRQGINSITIDLKCPEKEVVVRDLFVVHRLN